MVHASVEALERLLNLHQDSGTSQDYYKRFINAADILETTGCSVGLPKIMQDELNIAGASRTRGDAEVKAERVRATQRFNAIMFILNTVRSQYGRYVQEL